MVCSRARANGQSGSAQKSTTNIARYKRQMCICKNNELFFSSINIEFTATNVVHLLMRDVQRGTNSKHVLKSRARMFSQLET